ncbi:MAG: Crp/Fnr family transcriptional regulator [Gammaproteobacteria bacterium]|nr:Crp/Fnr family transcriptional regulator [Gammaproteobacteria bacterium]
MNASEPEFSLEGLLEASGWYPLLSLPARQAVRDALRVESIATGTALSHQGDIPHAWCGVLVGLIKLSSVDAEGRAVTFCGLAPGSWFGEATLLRDAPFAVDAQALRPSKAAMLPADTFFWLLDTEPGFSHYILRLLSERLHWFMGHCYANRATDSHGRVARAVVGLFQPAGAASLTELRISQEEVSNIAGVSRQSCNTALRQLCASGMLEIDYGVMRVLDPSALRKLVQL